MTADRPPVNTLPKATMTDVKLHYLTLTLEQTIDETDDILWLCTESGVDIEGRGETAPKALADYAARVGDFQPPHREPPRRPNAQVVDPEEVSGE